MQSWQIDGLDLHHEGMCEQSTEQPSSERRSLLERVGDHEPQLPIARQVKGVVPFEVQIVMVELFELRLAARFVNAFVEQLVCITHNACHEEFHARPFHSGACTHAHPPICIHHLGTQIVLHKKMQLPARKQQLAILLTLTPASPMKNGFQNPLEDRASDLAVR